MRTIFHLIKEAATMAGILCVAGPLLMTHAQGATRALDNVVNALPSSISISSPVEDTVSLLQGTVTRSIGSGGQGSSAYLVTGHGPIFLPGDDES